MYITDERSGYPDVMEDISGARPTYYRPITPTAIHISIPELINFSYAKPVGLWQFLFVSGNDQCAWLSKAIQKTSDTATGTDKAYAELALQQASHISEAEPRIYNAPEGGIVIENRGEKGILTLLIEGTIGLIVRTGDGFHVRAEFNLTADSINELLVRYVQELQLLVIPSGS